MLFPIREPCRKRRSDDSTWGRARRENFRPRVESLEDRCTPSADPLTQWNDLGIVYKAPSGSAYYPSVVYDAGGFGAGSAPFRMWYSDGLGGAFVATSDNGTSCSAPTPLEGLNNDPHHLQVVYDPAGFGGAAYKYKTWFWDINAAGTPYTINSIAFAESTDGVHWVNEQSVTQNPAQPLVTGADTGWNRGSYGPINVHYQAGAANTGDNPWNYAYVMYYDGTDGSHEYAGLAYSSDGLNWSAYEPGPVLEGDPGAWDSYSVGYGTVIRQSANSFVYFYSGSTTSGVSQGIGVATSTDGIHWTKSPTNPIFNISQGVPYRSVRDYTPSVVQDNTGALWMYYTALGPNAADPKDIGVAQQVVPTPTSFIESVYQHLLDRSADPAGLAHWTTLLNTLGNTPTGRTAVVAQIETSAEYRYDEVNSLYAQYLKRSAAGDSGAQTWVNLLGGGCTLEQVAAQIAGSPEFVRTQTDGTIASWLNAFYLDALFRPIDPGSLAYWSEAFAKATRAQIAEDIFTAGPLPGLPANEYRMDLVSSYYSQFLDRSAAADPGSLHWAALLQQGVRDQAVIAGILGSDEFYANSV